MSELIIGLIVAFLGLLGFGTFKSRKLSEQKKETEQEKRKVEILEKQIETIKEVRNEIKTIEEEPQPAEATPPAAGDHDSRLDRLNKLHKH